MTAAGSLSLERIAEAARVIDPVFLHSPQFVSDTLSDRLGLRLLCKAELLNPIHSFKGRGADYFLQLQRLGPDTRPLVCASAASASGAKPGLAPAKTPARPACSSIARNVTGNPWRCWWTTR
jgi:threonine dehydratase